MNPAQPKHAEIPKHGPSIRLRLEIELPLESPDFFRCLQAHRQSPRLLSVKSAPEVRVLPSAGITRHQRYYHPFRCPPAPPPEVTLRPLPSPATGLPRLPVSPSLRAVPTTPADRNGCIRRLLPRSTRPSPNLRRVGVHIFTFEACSGFTSVRPARSLNRPRRPLSQGFGPAGYPTRPPVSYQIKPTAVWVDPSSTGVTRRRGALRNAGHSAAAPHSLPAWLALAFWRIDQYVTAPSLLGSPGHRFGSPRCAAPRGRSSTVLAPAGKQYDVCLFPGRAEEQSPHVPRKTGNVLTAAWPIAINVMVACRPTSGTTSSLPERMHWHLGRRPRSNAPSQSLPRTEQAPHAVPSPVDLANATRGPIQEKWRRPTPFALLLPRI